MATHSKLSIKNVTAALIEHRGILSKAAEACNVSRRAFYAFLELHPELEEVRKDARDTIMDVAESHIFSAVSVGDMKTVRWFAERMGKDRGYVTRVEETGKDGGPLEIGSVERRVVDPADNDRDE